MASKRGGNCCAAIDCSVTTYNLQKISLFRFPKDAARCKKWRSNTKRSDLSCKSVEELNQHFRLCSRHFEDSQFMNTKHDKLIWSAIPTLFDVPNKPSPVTQKHWIVKKKPKFRVSAKTSTSIPTEHNNIAETFSSIASSSNFEFLTSVNEQCSRDMDIPLGDRIHSLSGQAAVSLGMPMLPQETSTSSFPLVNPRTRNTHSLVSRTELNSKGHSNAQNIPCDTLEKCGLGMTVLSQETFGITPQRQSNKQMGACSAPVSESSSSTANRARSASLVPYRSETLASDQKNPSMGCVARKDTGQWALGTAPWCSAIPSIPIDVSMSVDVAEDVMRGRTLHRRESGLSGSADRTVEPKEMAPDTTKLKTEIVKLQSQLKRHKNKEKSTINCNNSMVQMPVSCDHLIAELCNHFPPATVDFLRTQINMGHVSKQGRRWTVQEKMFAMSIFYQSRKSYMLLQTIFCMPSKRTLQRTLQNCSLYSGFSKHFIDSLKIKMQHASDMAKDCVLILDEMALKRKLVYNRERDCVEGFEDFGNLGSTQYIADHVLVFMLRGISVKWKQPLAYFFVCGSVKPTILSRILHDCLAKLEDVELFPKAVICDQGPTNRCYLETLEKVSVSQPFLMHGCKKVFVIYDPPHLLKSIRNNFKKHDFVLGSGENKQNVSWKHVSEFYAFDRSLPIRMAPRLTDKHLDLPPFTSMRVNLAAQVLSHSVAAGIQTLCRLGKLDTDAEHTAKFIDMFDRIFNACNSRTIKSPQPMGHAVSKGSGHDAFFQDTLTYLQVLKPARSKKELPCISGWQITIKSIIELWKNLCAEKKYKFLLTSRLNQDCIENFFSTIRGCGGHRDNPDVTQFRASFRFIAVDKLFVNTPGHNCEHDLDNLLLNISSLSNLMKSRSLDHENCLSTSHIDHEITCEMTCEDDFDLQDLSDIPDLSLETDNVLAYMSGYVLRKCDFNNNGSGMCQKCNDFYTSAHLLSAPEFSFIQQKTFKDTGCLIYPSMAFIAFTQKLEQLFQNSFDKLQHNSGILKRLCLFAHKNLEIIACGTVTCDARLKYMIRLYMTVRIHSKIKFLNQQLQNSCKPKIKRNRKAKKILHD